METDIAALINAVRDNVAKRVHATFPDMESNTFSIIVKQTVAAMKTSIQENEHKMKITGSGTNFLSLSAELRNQIYEYALQPKDASVPRQRYCGCGSMSTCSATKLKPCRKDNMHDLRVSRKQRHKIPALLHASRQVRSETMALFYSDKYFAFRIPTPQLRNEAADWLRAIGPTQKAMVRKVILRFQMTSGRLAICVCRVLRGMSFFRSVPLFKIRKEHILEACGLDELDRNLFKIEYRHHDGRIVELKESDMISISGPHNMEGEEYFELV
ncbi:Hypothetical predicted protein [Lecanosticta acicola]|uniref:2EXR domain-containing protein n=1 Tax=Lecanosticta acicola TaxID=111012 RepID=A0AAI8YZQ4_9PEZI|nr:Hypothetical predicted protein [Lecanosticta acicola]